MVVSTSSLLLVVFLLPLSELKNIDQHINIRLYRHGSRRFEEAGITEGHALFTEEKGFNKNLPVYLIIHGMAMGADSYFVHDLIDALQERGHQQEFNILAVDMPKLFANNLFNNFYFGVLNNVEPAGLKIGDLLDRVIRMNMTAPEKVYIVGYSIGAQVAGYAARRVMLNHAKIKYIAGLDPAGPGFHPLLEHSSRLTHVSKEDANVTHFFHTNSGMCGTMDRIGTADFVFNDGNAQPGCTRTASLDCSHTRIPLLYIESVLKPNSFVARQCSSWNHFWRCHCRNHKSVKIMFPPDLSAKGVYYLQTRSTSPFGMEIAGSTCLKIRNHKSRKNHHLKHKHYAYNLKTDLETDVNVHIMNGIKHFEQLNSLPEILNKTLSKWNLNGSIH